MEELRDRQMERDRESGTDSRASGQGPVSGLSSAAVENSAVLPAALLCVSDSELN